jgi:hypothetical protein
MMMMMMGAACFIVVLLSISIGIYIYKRRTQSSEITREMMDQIQDIITNSMNNTSDSPIVEKKTIKRKAVEDEVAGIMLELACPPRKKMFSDPIERILMGVDHIFGSMNHTMTIYNRSCMEDFCRVFQFLLSESRVYTNDGYPVSLLHAYQHYIQNCK